MHQAVPYIVLGIFSCIGIVLFIGGCSVSKNWYPLFVLIPALLTVLSAYFFMKTGPYGVFEGGIISKDTWLFFLLVSVTSMVGLPLVFYHCDTISSNCLLMHLCADLLTGIGFGLFMFLTTLTEAYNGMQMV